MEKSKKLKGGSIATTICTLIGAGLISVAVFKFEWFSKFVTAIRDFVIEKMPPDALGEIPAVEAFLDKFYGIFLLVAVIFTGVMFLANQVLLYVYAANNCTVKEIVVEKEVKVEVPVQVAVKNEVKAEEKPAKEKKPKKSFKEIVALVKKTGNDAAEVADKGVEVSEKVATAINTVSDPAADFINRIRNN